MPKRAPFIVIEGLDRSGKSTQAALLHDHIQATISAAAAPSPPPSSHVASTNPAVFPVGVQLIKFPDRTTPIGKMIDSYLRSESELDDHVVHLLFSANRWELATSIERALLEGTAILCDRYAFSGIAFSASKVAAAAADPTPLLSYEWCRAPDISLPSPDLTLFLDIHPSAAKLRGGYGQERYENEDLQKRVRGVFARLGEEMGGAGARDASDATIPIPTTATTGTGTGRTTSPSTKWVTIDASQSMDAVRGEIWNHVKPLIENGIDAPIARLWTSP